MVGPDIMPAVCQCLPVTPHPDLGSQRGCQITVTGRAGGVATGRAGGVARGQRGQQEEHPARGDITGSRMPTARSLDPSLLFPGLT